MATEIHTLSAESLAPLTGVMDRQNRQWVHIMTKGRIETKDGRVFFADDLDAIIAASKEHVGKNRILVDYEHQSMKADEIAQPVPAAGWITGLQARQDGIWAHVEWTDRAATYIRANEYRYLSPGFNTGLDRKVTRIFHVALVNQPAIDELTALAKQEKKMEDNTTDGVPENMLSELRKLLKLDASSGADAILNAIKSLVEHGLKATPDPAKYVPIGEFEKVVKQANSLNQGIGAEAAALHVDHLIEKGTLSRGLRDWAINLCKVNKPELDGFVERTGPAMAALLETSHTASAPPAGERSSSLGDDEKSIAAKMGLTDEEYAKSRDQQGISS